MKNTSYIVSYIFMLIIGVLLMVFSDRQNIFEIIIAVIGVCLVIPSVVSLFMGFSGKKMPDGTRQSRPWYIATTAIAGLVGGVLLICMPGFFVKYLIYTLSIILIVAGVAQIVFISTEGRDIGGMSAAYYIMPWLTLLGGVVFLIMGPERIASIVTIITGALLALYGINGLLTAAVHRGAARRIIRNNAAAAAAVAKEAEVARKAEEEARKAEKAAEKAEKDQAAEKHSDDKEPQKEGKEESEKREENSSSDK